MEISQVVERLKADWDEHLSTLEDLVRIPSVSFDGYPPEEVKRSAEAVAKLLKDSGLENVELLELPGVHPYVYGEWLKAPGKPTLLLYAHHDVQPPGREDVWRTPPFEPTRGNSPQGERLFGRGTADDKAGILVHTSAIQSYLRTLGELPVNVKVLIEGEEETGSAHLAEFLKKYKDRMSADVLVLTDTMNFDCGTPGLTTSLRGMVGIEIELSGLKNTLHSGMWGGPVPDPAMALSKIHAQMVDEQGNVAIPKIVEMIPELSAEEKQMYESLPYGAERLREQTGMLDGVEVLNPSESPLIQIWRKPSLMVNAVEASSRESAGNIINDSAWSKVTVRVPPGMSAERVRDALIEFVKERTPWGLSVKITEEVCASPWSTDPKKSENQAAFEAAALALKEAYGKPPVLLGCGGSIPFVEPFAEVLGAPALLVGVEDPYTNAHGENESLLLEDFKSACIGQVLLFNQLSMT